MGLHWSDSIAIAECLYDEHPEINPKQIRFIELRQYVLNLNEFEDDPNHCGEKVLEAIQQAWIEEVN